MLTHIFTVHCVDFEELLDPKKWVNRKKTLDNFLVALDKQSKTQEAKIRVDITGWENYTDSQSCPAYFGMGVEWLAWNWINHYGRNFNIQCMEMTDSVDSAKQDYGVDGTGQSIVDAKSLFRKTNRRPVQFSPVYLQVKGTLNKMKEYTPNDGSRLPNFGLNAMSEAIKTSKAYQARYVLFTTGKGMHFSLENMSNGMFEVINYKNILDHMGGDFVFLNKLRVSVGLPVVAMPDSDPDAEASHLFSDLEESH